MAFSLRGGQASNVGESRCFIQIAPMEWLMKLLEEADFSGDQGSLYLPLLYLYGQREQEFPLLYSHATWSYLAILGTFLQMSNY